MKAKISKQEGKIGDLGFGFFNDIDIPIFKGDFEIEFFRDTDINALFSW